ncbi:hypothetical protein B0H13DRAFT_2274347 [Mycena leptocephala]|nr:hypothetical protein B0H13DRAFT_2274347 [Mycena leptocephala]
MQFKVVAFIAALFTVAAAQTDCLTILQGSVCPVGYRVCGPVRVDSTKCCPPEFNTAWVLTAGCGFTPIDLHWREVEAVEVRYEKIFTADSYVWVLSCTSEIVT